MTPFFLYCLKTTVALALFYAFYRLLFDRDTFFEWKRGILISSILLSAIYPFIDLSALMQKSEPVKATITYYASDFPIIYLQPVVRSWWEVYDLSSALWLIYLAGVVVLSLRMAVQMYSIFRLAGSGERITLNNVNVIRMKEATAPFSFFKWIFISPEIHKPEDLKEIMVHEQTHVREWHSLDVLLSEITLIAFWFNPFAWLTKIAIRQNLEFLADKRVIVSGHDSKNYQYHLLRLTHQSAAAHLVNNFNVSQLKKRIIMINKEKTSSLGLAKYLTLLPLVSVLLITNGAQMLAQKAESNPTVQKVVDKINNNIRQTVAPQESPATDTNQELLAENITETLPAEAQEAPTKAAAMPVFAGGQQEMNKYIAQKLRYPVSAQNSNISGTVIATYVITKTGEITDIKITKSPDQSLSNEAIRLIQSMPAYTPGKDEKGENTDVQMTLPINFVLNGIENPKVENIPGSFTVVAYPPKESAIQADQKDKPFMIVEQMPQFEGGENALNQFIAKNLKYPADAAEKGISGTVVVRFVVGKTGDIKDAAVVRGVNESLDKEALRVINLLPKWKPGMQKGEAVDVYFAVPIRYTLSKSSSPSISDLYFKQNPPLIIIDGKESTAEEIKNTAKEKIESINILKDNAAKEAYGEKGKNGVIVVTLKKQ